MTFRDELQDKLANVAHGIKQGILFVAPRVGKCRIGIRLLEKIGKHPKTLIVYPDLPIRKSWEDEIEKMGYNDKHITFSTNMSLHKHVEEQWDVIILDEIHRLSKRNIQLLAPKCHQNSLGTQGGWIIGLTGSLSNETKEDLKGLKMRVIASYTQEQAIDDEIVSDYQINVVEVPLDNKTMIQYKKKVKTEKQQFDAYSFIINKLQNEGRNTMFLALARMRIIQGSIAKLEATKELLRQFKDERVLVFCGLIKIADQLGIPAQHSESDDNINEFLEGRVNHQAIIRMGASGITYIPLNKVIMNYFSSKSEDFIQKLNRATNLEFEGKIAQIYIISSTEVVEKRWLHQALSSFPKNKIKYTKL